MGSRWTAFAQVRRRKKAANGGTAERSHYSPIEFCRKRRGSAEDQLVDDDDGIDDDEWY